MKTKILIVCLAIASLLVSHASAQHGHDAGAAKKKNLMIAANPSVSKQTGWPIGCWAAELTHPYWEFVNAGYEVEIASPNGGKLEFDAYSNPMDSSGYSAHDLISLGFMNSPKHLALIENTKKLSAVNGDEYDAIFLVGGQSPMYTFRGNKPLQKFVMDFYESGKPTALVCHSTCVLLEAKLSNGKYLVEGKTWTGFADSEEEYADKLRGPKNSTVLDRDRSAQDGEHELHRQERLRAVRSTRWQLDYRTAAKLRNRGG